MKFLCDVHISIKLVKQIASLGFECIHVNNILNKWHTKDAEIAKFVDQNNYTLITKDSDFRNSFFVNRTPKKLIKINTGNTSNEKLHLIFEENLLDISLFTEKLDQYLIEIDTHGISLVSDNIS